MPLALQIPANRIPQIRATIVMNVIAKSAVKGDPGQVKVVQPCTQ